MANQSKQAKRSKRAKEKAKQIRLNKQKKRQQQAQDSVAEVTVISEHLITLFKTLPAPSPEFECVPAIKRFYQEYDDEQSVDDLKLAVAMTVVMFAHWYHCGDTEITDFELAHYEAVAVQPKFNEAFFGSTIEQALDELEDIVNDSHQGTNPRFEIDKDLKERLVDWLVYMDGDPPIDNNDDFRALRSNRSGWTFDMCAIYWEFARELTGQAFTEEPDSDVEQIVRAATEQADSIFQSRF